LEDYARRRLNTDLSGMFAKAMALAIAVDKVADSLDELRVLSRTLDSGDIRQSRYEHLEQQAENGASRVQALIVAIAEAHEAGQSAERLEAQLDNEEQRVSDDARDALILQRLMRRTQHERSNAVRPTHGRTAGR
jgi:hypothetical protein